MPDGRSVIIHHRTAGTVEDPPWNSMITMEEELCSGGYPLHFDIPDTIAGYLSGAEGLWPKGDIYYDEAKDPCISMW